MIVSFFFFFNIIMQPKKKKKKHPGYIDNKLKVPQIYTQKKKKKLH